MRGRPNARLTVVAALLPVMSLAACTRSSPSPASTPPAGTSSPVTAPSTATGNGRSITVVAAGDIAATVAAAARTARLVKRIKPDTVLTLGDNAYSSGSREQYAEKYDPTWGAFKKITRPVPGNHDYETRDAAGYFGYFRAQIHGRAYYAFNAGDWRLYALNCEIECGPGSAQVRWLRDDLAAHADRPSLAYVHEPRFTCSTHHSPFPELAAAWDLLDQAGGQLMLAGHNHAYERFAPMDGHGRPSTDGMRQFVVGTGGAAFYRTKGSCPHRAVEHDTSSGVLELTLRRDSYSWRFLDVKGRSLDSGTEPVRMP